METNNTTALDIVERIFSNWTGLKLAVEHGMGSTEKARNFCQYVAEMLSMNEQLHYSDVALELEDYMDAEFNTTLEDDSEKQVSEDVCRFYSYIQKNDIEKLNGEMAKLPPVQPWITLKQVSKVVEVAKVDNDDEDDEEVSASNSKMDVDEDGFSIVRRKKK